MASQKPSEERKEEAGTTRWRGHRASVEQAVAEPPAVLGRKKQGLLGKGGMACSKKGSLGQMLFMPCSAKARGESYLSHSRDEGLQATPQERDVLEVVRWKRQSPQKC